MAQNPTARLDITAENRTKPAFDAVRRSMRDVEDATSSLRAALSGIGGVLSLGALVSLASKIASATIDAERSSARLDAALQATGHAAGVTRGEIEALADELKIKTPFDDDEVRKGMASLLRFRDIQGAVFKDAARLAPDLAVALDVGLTDAYQRLGRALQDPATGLRGLRDAGLKLSESQLENIRRMQDFGDKAGAQKLVIEELTKSIGGAAAGENVGLYGASKSLGKAWDDALKALGKTEIFTGAAHAGFELLKQDLQAIESIAKSNAVQGAFGGAKAGKIGGGPISPVDFGGTSELQARIDYFNELIKLAQKRPQIKPDESIKKLLDEGTKGWVAYADAIFNASETELNALNSGESFSEWAEKLQGTTLDNIDGTRKWRRELDDLVTLFKTGYLSLQQFNQASMSPELRELLQPKKTSFNILNEALKEGDISLDQYMSALDRLRGKNQDVTDDITEFWKQAARNMENATGTLFFDVMQGNLSDLGLQVKTVIDHMVAELLAAKAATALFGKNFGKEDVPLGGFIGEKVVPFLADLFKADGGPVSSNTPYIVGERGPELFVPRSAGSIVPNGQLLGGATIINNITVNGAVDRRSAQQIAAQTGLAVQRALARGA